MFYLHFSVKGKIEKQISWAEKWLLVLPIAYKFKEGTGIPVSDIGSNFAFRYDK